MAGAPWRVHPNPGVRARGKRDGVRTFGDVRPGGGWHSGGNGGYRKGSLLPHPAGGIGSASRRRLSLALLQLAEAPRDGNEVCGTKWLSEDDGGPARDRRGVAERRNHANRHV